MLQSFVAPVIILAATLSIDPNCIFESDEQLPHSESLYSNRGRLYDMYSFSSDIPAYSELKNPKDIDYCPGFIFYAVDVVFHWHMLEKVRPRRF